MSLERAIRMAEPKIDFDASTFLASAGLGRRIAKFKPKQALFSQGPARGRYLLSPEWPSQSDGCVDQGQRSHNHASLGWRFCWGGVDGKCRGASHGSRHRGHCLHSLEKST